MIQGHRFEDTPSLLGRTITGVRPGQALRYAELTAREKRDYLFDEGVRPTAYERFPGEARPDVIPGLVQFTGSAWESITSHLLARTLTRESDELETPKPKLFHTYGATAEILFTPEADTPYTGLLGETAPGLARFSYAGPVRGVGVVPGLGWKFPVAGDRPSENAVFMRKLDRQQPVSRFLSTDSHNSVFQHPFTNILPLPRQVNLVMRVVKRRFERVVAEGRGLHQPVDNLARVHGDGRPVPAADVRAPHRLILAPTAEVQERSDPTIDFRDDLARNVPAGTRIYEVFALDEEEEQALRDRTAGGGGRPGRVRLEALLPGARRIGTVTTESEFIASKYGDYRLFFQHNRHFLRPELAG